MNRTTDNPTAYHIWNADTLKGLAKIDPASVDAVITDPPYPGVEREYGYWTVSEWRDLMRDVVREVRRVLTPTGSAVFILQPSAPSGGTTDPWLWEWLAETAREWNLIQVCYAWNKTTLPSGAATTKGLMRHSVKYCCWFGAGDCYRNQAAILNPVSESMKRDSRESKFRRSGHTVDRARMRATANRRGGTTPFNVIEYASTSSAEDVGNPHPAKTQYVIADRWVRYISEPEDIILDPFCGSGTVGLAALKRGRHFLGIDKEGEYVLYSNKRLADAQDR